MARRLVAQTKTRPDPMRNAGHTRERPVSGEIPELDRLIHERVRLGIVSALAVNDWLSFGDLKRLLHTTDGNLSVHARKLEQSGYVVCRKFFEGRVPRTEYRLSATGKRAFEQYLRDMEDVIRVNRQA